MAGVFVVLTAFLLCLPDPSEGISIEQSPPVGERPGESAELECHHDDSSYNYMYWYQQSRGPSQGIGVSQTPQVLLQGAGGSAGVFCEHDGGISYNEMYWYRQLRGQGIQLLVFSMFGSAPQFEKDFNEERYEVNRPTATKGSLKIKQLEPGDSALYFCSAIKHSDTIPLQHLAKSTLPSLLPTLVL
ncbi:UNVERIFIED_CONTAM: hypothetical protein FKN15_062062 [Acipenser sinensis]